MSDQSKILLPWVCDHDWDIQHYRYPINGPNNAIGYIKYPHGSCLSTNVCSCYANGRFITTTSSLEEAKAAVDTVLLEKGYRLLTEEEVKRLELLK